jgi:hypothetical protein
MTTCTRCHRPLKYPSATGMGDVCTKRAAAAPIPVVERDLFGYDLDMAEAAARLRVGALIDSMVADAEMAVRRGFRAARVALGVWS